jgi:hypothetical protein
MHRLLTFISTYVREFVAGFASDSIFVLKHIARTFRVAPAAGVLGEAGTSAAGALGRAIAATLRLIVRLLVSTAAGYLLASVILGMQRSTWAPGATFNDPRFPLWWLAFFALVFVISLRYPRDRASGAADVRERGFFARLGRGIVGVCWRIGFAAAVSYPLTGAYLSLAYAIPTDLMMRYLMSGELARLRLRQTNQEIFSEPYWILTTVIAFLLFWRWFRTRRR